MLTAVTGFIARLPSAPELDKVGMMRGAVYVDRSVPCRGGNSWTRGLTAAGDADVVDGDVSVGLSRPQLTAVNTTHYCQQRNDKIDIGIH